MENKMDFIVLNLDKINPHCIYFSGDLLMG